MEPFKNLLGAAVVRDCAHHLARAWPPFDARRFESLASHGLEALELKARVEHIADALEQTLPAQFDQAARILEASLAPAPPDDSLDAPRSPGAGLAGWAVWPLTSYVARAGLATPQRALLALHAMTQRSTAEFAVRPFLVHHTDLTLRQLETWTQDPSPHVRRLVSEGSRPRLPWGLQLKALIADPRPTLPLLRALQDDASEYVRRSVANHLNDIAKDHPAIVVDWVREHLPGAPPARVLLLKHASRSLVKQGHAPMLRLWGVAARLRGTVGLALSKRRVKVGESLELRLTLSSDSARVQKLAVDYAVHHVKANGKTSAKVFKGWVIALAPGQMRALRKTHSMKPVTTRRYHAGRHEVDIRVNGIAMASAGFDLRL